MKGDDLQPGDQIVRYVKPSMIQSDGMADGSGFCLRGADLDEKGLSVNWLEAFGTEKAYQLREVRRLFRLRARSNGCFAELNVGTVLSGVSEELDTLRIVHDPLEASCGFDADPSHSEIIGLPPCESDLAALVGDLIAECVTGMHPAFEESMS